MATVACGVGAAVGGCVALVLALPAYALKEVYEARTKTNLKRHLGRRGKCRVTFANCDAATVLVEAVEPKTKVDCNPPLYGDIFQRRETPPPPYEHEKINDKIKNINEIPKISKIPVAPLKSALKRRQ